MKKERKKREAVLIIRLHTEERETLKEVAKSVGTTMSSLVRTTALNHISKSLKKV